MTDESSEYPSPNILDSRRLLGPNIYSARVGAVLEVAFDEADAETLIDAWAAHTKHLARALGWADVEACVKRQRAGAHLFFEAPVDALMTATQVNEQAWLAAESGELDAEAVRQIRAAAEEERRTYGSFARVYSSAASHGISVNFDDESVALGSGVGSHLWTFGELPPASKIPWRELRDVPTALVTGSNGKTTTTRLIAAMWRAAGRVAGWCCSDGVWVDDEQLQSGDYSGPAGAREVLRDKRVKAAVLETARGGILRRGLATTRAAAAIITNISADHFGEYGIENLHELAEVKAVVARALAPGDGVLVLNADDRQLVNLGVRVTVPVAWFSLGEHPLLGDNAATVRDGRVVLRVSGTSHDIGDAAEMPLTLGGTAPHNVANILGASLVAAGMGISVESIRETLARFGASATDNPGRLQLHRLGGVTVLTDYAHNPDGLVSLCETAKAIPATRRLLILGQAGNRDDDALRALARAALQVMPFDRVIIKEMDAMLRGRAAGEIPRIFIEELSRLGVPADNIEVAPSEIAAVRSALAWARDGDLLVCPVHVSKTEVMALLRTT